MFQQDSSFDINEKKKNSKYFKYRNFFKKIKNYAALKGKEIFKSKNNFINESESEIYNRKSKRPFWVHILHIFLFLLSYLFYYLSLIRCYDGEDICTMNKTWISTILVNLIISIIISTILFLLILYNKVSPLNLIHFVITFILFYKSSHLTFAFDHGYYNFVGITFKFFYFSNILCF